MVIAITMKRFFSTLLLILSAVTSVAHAHNCYGSYENTPHQATDDSKQPKKNSLKMFLLK